MSKVISCQHLTDLDSFAAEFPAAPTCMLGEVNEEKVKNNKWRCDLKVIIAWLHWHSQIEVGKDRWPNNWVWEIQIQELWGARISFEYLPTVVASCWTDLWQLC